MIQTKQFTLFRSSDPRPDITLSLFLTPHLEVYAACIFRHYSGILSGVYSDILFGILSGIYSDIFSGIFSDILSGIYYIFWHSFWHLFWHSIWHFYLTFYPGILSGIYSDILSALGTLALGSAHWDLELAVEVRQCPLTSGTRSWANWAPGPHGWGPAVPTEIWSWQFSGSAHWDLELPV